MAALCAGENTDKIGSRYVKPSLEGRFLDKFSDRAEKGAHSTRLVEQFRVVCYNQLDSSVLPAILALL